LFFLSGFDVLFKAQNDQQQQQRSNKYNK